MIRPLKNQLGYFGGGPASHIDVTIDRQEPLDFSVIKSEEHDATLISSLLEDVSDRRPFNVAAPLLLLVVPRKPNDHQLRTPRVYVLVIDIKAGTRKYRFEILVVKDSFRSQFCAQNLCDFFDDRS